MQLEFNAVRTVQYRVYRFFRQVFYRGVERYSVVLGNALEVHHSDRAFVGSRPAHGLYRPLPYGQVLVGDYKVGVYLAEHAQSGTFGAGPERIVERKHSGGKLVNGNPVLGTGVILGEKHFLAVNNVGDNKSA